MPGKEDLLEQWRSEKDFDRRDELYTQLKEAGLFPEDDMKKWEIGLYPEYDDPDFVTKLLKKREFQESKQEPIANKEKEGEDACRSSEDFELTPVQRFLKRLLSPNTPFMSALLYHGVGVGKTCAAVSIAEGFLELFPRKKVFIVSPPAIQAGFKTTIFDREGLTMGDGGDVANHHRGCTGQTYLQLTNSLYEPVQTTVEARVSARINARYEFFGYTQLYKFIKKVMDRIPASIGMEQKRLRENMELRREFSGRVLIIDEAHNLRDLPDEKEEENIDSPVSADESDSAGGKRLTPYLRRVLEVAEGMTLVLLTATPMYNSYREIIFLLNLLLKNDKRETIHESDVFVMSGASAGQFKPGGEELLGRIASCYVSFMRGENPLTFPVRLDPLNVSRVDTWPKESPTGGAITEQQGSRASRLPIVGCPMTVDTEIEYRKLSDSALEPGGGGLGITNIDLLIQAGNWIFPGSGSAAAADDDNANANANAAENIRGRIRQGGFDATFQKEKRGSSVVYSSTAGDASWLAEEQLPAVSGKAAFLVNRLRTCRGIAFVYSRFVITGALSIALALEANGYTPWGREIGLLGDGIQTRGGRQCALCPSKENGHGTSGPQGAAPQHPFTPAKYVLLTGLEEISPNNPVAIKAARARSNAYGKDVKVVIGSQVAGEGLDLRFVREIYVFDSWFHLNKLEQVIGRGVRNCSHAAFEEKERNTTIYLLVNTYQETPERETIDMYSYRTALQKAVIIGRVTRALKKYALDCSLNYQAIHVAGLHPRAIVDGQGTARPSVNINDVPFSPLCDWLETCEYTCATKVSIPLHESDTDTYDEYAARWRISQVKRALQGLFKTRSFFQLEDLENALGNIPRAILGTILYDLVSNKEFVLYNETEKGLREGSLYYKNGYFLFQPSGIEDVHIPLAIRMANVPVKQDFFTPRLLELEQGVEGEKGVGEEEGVDGKRVDTEELWNVVVRWSQTLEDGTGLRLVVSDATDTRNVPGELLTELRHLSKGNTKLLRQWNERVGMIPWMFPFLARPEHEGLRKGYARIVREYIWDEFLSFDTQQTLAFGSSEAATASEAAAGSEAAAAEAIEHARWTIEGNNYLRLYNAETGVIQYFQDGIPVSRGIVEVLSKESARDPIRSRSIQNRTTGSQYGFFVKKGDQIIFKIAEPPTPGKKVERGARCSIDSNLTYQLGKLIELGKILQAASLPSLDLVEPVLVRERPFKNSTRACTLLDLGLRWMNVLAVGGKRWLYRPLEAALLGHKAEK